MWLKITVQVLHLCQIILTLKSYLIYSIKTNSQNINKISSVPQQRTSFNLIPTLCPTLSLNLSLSLTLTLFLPLNPNPKNLPQSNPKMIKAQCSIKVKPPVLKDKTIQIYHSDIVMFLISVLAVVDIIILVTLTIIIIINSQVMHLALVAVYWMLLKLSKYRIITWHQCLKLIWREVWKCLERVIIIIISHLGCLVRFRRPRKNQNLGTRRRTIRKEYTEPWWCIFHYFNIFENFM